MTMKVGDKVVSLISLCMIGLQGASRKTGEKKSLTRFVRLLKEMQFVFCPNPEDAKWIAERLNLAAKLEKRSKDDS
jgi:hypothetical protein